LRGPQWVLVYRVGWTELYRIRKKIISRLSKLLDFPYVVPLSNGGESKAIVVENRCQIPDFLALNIRGRMGEVSEDQTSCILLVEGRYAGFEIRSVEVKI